MDADWSVELGHDDPSLEFPWPSPGGTQRYVNLSQHPEALADIPEAAHYPELGDFLRQVNAKSSSWLTAKCDVWLDDEIADAELIYRTNVKLCSYVDLIARDVAARSSFERHELWVKTAARQLTSAEEEPVSGEFIVRRCWYHAETAAEQLNVDPAGAIAKSAPGFYVTFYLFGYGRDQADAREQWAEGLRRVTAIIAALAA
ncbi:MAG TPA: hypothetical protein VMU05_16385 [Dongiaceae bacterium]|nr:hypothetical protein [Dongiaceae bacterium]